MGFVILLRNNKVSVAYYDRTVPNTGQSRLFMFVFGSRTPNLLRNLAYPNMLEWHVQHDSLHFMIPQNRFVDFLMFSSAIASAKPLLNVHCIQLHRYCDLYEIRQATYKWFIRLTQRPFYTRVVRRLGITTLHMDSILEALSQRNGTRFSVCR